MRAGQSGQAGASTPTPGSSAPPSTAPSLPSPQVVGAGMPSEAAPSFAGQEVRTRVRTATASQRDVGRRLGHAGTNHWAEFTSGASCEANGCSTANSAAECEAAAQELASKSMTSSVSYSSYPAGCFKYSNGNFYFNTRSTSSITCALSTEVCVCYCVCYCC